MTQILELEVYRGGGEAVYSECVQCTVSGCTVQLDLLDGQYFGDYPV